MATDPHQLPVKQLYIRLPKNIPQMMNPAISSGVVSVTENFVVCVCMYEKIMSYRKKIAHIEKLFV